MSEEKREAGQEMLDAVALGRAGEVVERTIAFLAEQQTEPMIVASALLGGALGLLTSCLEDAAVIRILENAIASVQSGEFRNAADEQAGGA